MNNRYFVSVFLSALMIFAVIGGCSDDDPAAPATDVATYLHGVVIAANGAPLEGVSIGLIYDLPGLLDLRGSANVISRPAEKPMTGIRFNLPEPAAVRVWITDYAGDFVVTLVDDHIEPGDHTSMWAGLDESGSPVPSGVYYAHCRIEDDAPTVYPLFLLFLDPTDFLRHANDVTDELGAFRIPDSLIPVGESFDIIDETGAVSGQTTVSDQIRVVAVREGATDPEWVDLAISYLADGGNGKLELTLP